MKTKAPKVINYIPNNMESLPLQDQLKFADKQYTNILRVGKYIVKNGTREEKQQYLKTLLEVDKLRMSILDRICALHKAFSLN